MLFLYFCVAPVWAGERFLAWSYGTNTASEGGLEIEPITTLETHQADGERVSEWTHEVELEYGITSALEGGLYLVGSQTNDAAFTFSGYKARLRYRFWPLGSHAVDMAAYVEYIGVPTFDEHGLEGKWILAKEGQKFRMALNVTTELTFSEDGVEPVLEPTAGVVWRLNQQVALGMEGKVETVFVNPVEGPYAWAGPTVHLSGKDSMFTWTVSAMYGLTQASREDAVIEARSLIGIER